MNLRKDHIERGHTLLCCRVLCTGSVSAVEEKKLRASPSAVVVASCAAVARPSSAALMCTDVVLV